MTDLTAVIESGVEAAARDLAAAVFFSEQCPDDAGKAVAEVMRLSEEWGAAVQARRAQTDDDRRAMADIMGRITARAETIIRDLTADPSLLTSEYFDLLPAEWRAKVSDKVLALMREAGASAERMKDAEGNTFFVVGNLEAIGIDAADLRDDPAPVGQLRRLH